MDFANCSATTSNKIISVSENKRCFRIINKSKLTISKVLVDGCLITDDRVRCDFLFEIDNPITTVFYVELKGSDIEHASKQLSATIGYCKKYHSGLNIMSYIVASQVRVPKSGPGLQGIKKRFSKKCGSPLEIYTSSKTVQV